MLDILLTQQNEAVSEQLLAFRHRLQDDHAFLKVLGVCYLSVSPSVSASPSASASVSLLCVMYILSPLFAVLSGYCYHDCTSGQKVRHLCAHSLR